LPSGLVAEATRATDVQGTFLNAGADHEPRIRNRRGSARRRDAIRPASDNLGSLRVLEKAGFRRIGVNRDFRPGRGEEIEEAILRLD